MSRLLTWPAVTAVLSLLVVPAPPAGADDNLVKGAVEKAAEAGFSDLERRVIREYLGKHGLPEDNDTAHGPSGKGNKHKKNNGKGMPPGLAKRDRLPPGLERQLQKNGTLPPGLAKRDLPHDLQSRLPPPPKGYERSIVEDATVVLVEKATGRIADIITDVMTGNE